MFPDTIASARLPALGRRSATRLGPDHLQGTQPAHRDKNAAKGAYVWDKRTAKMKAESGRPYIAGHLLNHHVGGPGNDARNLVAIPADVNSKMETDVEDPVKELWNDFQTGLRSYDDELKQAEHLIGTLVEVAKKSANRRSTTRSIRPRWGPKRSPMPARSAT